MMQQIDLGGGRTVLLRELRPKDLRALLCAIPDEVETMTWRTLALEHWNRLAEPLQACLEVHGADSWEELTLSELMQVGRAFQEMHADFFDLFRRLMVVSHQSSTGVSDPSITSVADSSSKGTGMSGSTAAPFSER